MIIPVRCMTCGKVLADKWEYYVKRCNDLKAEGKGKGKEAAAPAPRYFEKNTTGQVLDELELTKMCCRRHFLGHVDLIETI